MIQANELRRNNLIMYGNMIYPVERITETSISVRLSSQSLRTGRPHEFEPIPLSPEILLACGFTPLSDPEFTHHHPELNILFDGEFFWLKEGKITHYLSKCEYLHKLQNGVFWVTGKELIVNIEKVKV